jgi:hypothetical protein
LRLVPGACSPATLLRESHREHGKVRKRTLCNLSDWPVAHIEGLRGVLKGGTVIASDRDAFTISRSLPHGHVAAALGTARKIGLDRILGYFLPYVSHEWGLPAQYRDDGIAGTPLELWIILRLLPLRRLLVQRRKRLLHRPGSGRAH